MSRFGSLAAAGGGSSQAQIQALIQQLSQQRTSQLSQIEQLFQDFGVSAKQDITEATAERGAQEEQSLVRRGLGSTTIVGGRLGRIAREGARETRRVDEGVARQKAGFLERQLIDPSTILNLIQQASAAPNPNERVQVRGPAGSRFGPSGIGQSSFGVRPAGQSGGINTLRPNQGGGIFGQAARGSRIITRRGSFSPGQFSAQRGGSSIVSRLQQSGAFRNAQNFSPRGGSQIRRAGGSRTISSGSGSAQIIRRG
jgi:hypothetical protein